MTSPFQGITAPGTITTTTKPGEIITNLLPYLFGAAGIILLFMIISSGYQMMTSAGDPKKMQAAQGKLTTSIIGVLILFVSFFIVQLLFKFLNLPTTVKIF